MSMMDSIAAMGMEMKATQFEQNYSVAVAKKAMDAQEQMAERMISDMLPRQAQIPKGDFIDVTV